MEGDMGIYSVQILVIPDSSVRMKFQGTLNFVIVYLIFEKVTFEGVQSWSPYSNILTLQFLAVMSFSLFIINNLFVVIKKRLKIWMLDIMAR